MNPTLTRIIVAIGALLVLGAVNLSIQGKEDIKANGETVLLELAPVDPRSLMQGDYMALRFAIAQAVDVKSGYKDERLPLQIDEHRVGRLAPSGSIANLHIRYRVRNGQLWLGTNAFFFEEGTATRYSHRALWRAQGRAQERARQCSSGSATSTTSR